MIHKLNKYILFAFLAVKVLIKFILSRFFTHLYYFIAKPFDTQKKFRNSLFRLDYLIAIFKTLGKLIPTSNKTERYGEFKKDKKLLLSNAQVWESETQKRREHRVWKMRRETLWFDFYFRKLF